MKKLILPLSHLALGLTSCVESKTEILELLQNNDTRKEVLKTITTNYEYMEDLNQEMINSGSAIQIFEANPDMVNHLINNDGMVDLLKKNPQAKEQMMAMMLQDTLLNSQLIERAIQDENNTAKLVKQLEASKILTTGCATKANKEVARKFAALKPVDKKK